MTLRPYSISAAGDRMFISTGFSGGLATATSARLGAGGDLIVQKIELIRTDAGITDRYLMPLNGVSLPADGTAPLAVPVLMQASFAGSQVYQPLGWRVPATGLALVASSTATTLTLDNTVTAVITAYCEEYEFPTYGATTAGDLTTARTNLQVWADASGPHELRRVDVNYTAGGTDYLQLFANDSPADGEIPIIPSIPLSGKTKFVLNFHTYPRSQSGSTLRDGCTLVFSSTAATKTVVLSNAGTIQATYV